jgi:DNA-directed RNA polymerase specialized sigma24 family protein
MDGRVPDAKTILAVDEAVTRLGGQEPVIAQVVQLHFFAGLTLDEIADAIGASRATIYRQWAYARALLRLTLQGKGADTGG